MADSAYKAAIAVAPAVASHFFNHHLAASAKGEEDLAPVPDLDAIESMIDAGFWSSLRREEGHSPKISLAFIPPEKTVMPLIFGRPIPLTPAALTKLAPGVERSGIHIGVWRENDELFAWGTTRVIPPLCFVVEVVEPGLIVIKHRRNRGSGKFVNVAILKGDQIKIVSEDTSNIPDCPTLLSSLMGLSSNSTWNDSVTVLVQIAVSMRAHGRGGTVLIVPEGSDSWRESIVHPITYPVLPAFCGLAELLHQDEMEKQKPSWQIALTREVDNIAGLTAVDGAMVLTDGHKLLAFGAKIKRAYNSEPVEQVIITEPIVGGEAAIIHPTQNGGTRHLSAAQFVFDQRDAIALVASQDGRFTIFAWSPCEGMVHAHRVDTLLL